VITALNLNKKLKQLARKSALSYKAKDMEIVIIEDFSFEAPKQKVLLISSASLR
jgi:large subunit ribosomal protein L4